MAFVVTLERLRAMAEIKRKELHELRVLCFYDQNNH